MKSKIFYLWSGIRQNFRYLFKRFNFTKRATKLFGYRYKRDPGQVNILLTNRCHRECIDCSQFCTQAPSRDKLSIEQIQKFFRQSIENDKKWKVIRITGGEATLDDDLPQVFLEIKKYLRFSPKTRVELLSNGYGYLVKERLKKTPNWVKIINTNKSSSFHPYFLRMTVAPADLKGYQNADFQAGCYGLRSCALTITKNGYYPCAVSSGIDRIFGFNLGRKNLPSDGDSMREILAKTCRFCGLYVFSDTKTKPGHCSKSWEKALASYKKKKPPLDDF